MPIIKDMRSAKTNAAEDLQALEDLEQPAPAPGQKRRMIPIASIADAKQTTGIEWTNATWNPFVGCDVHTAGCKNCYAMKQAAVITAKHYEGVLKWVKGIPVWSGHLNQSPPHILNKPRTMRGEAMIFVNSMSDFFHGKAELKWQFDAMKVMKETPQHTYQILTKRPENITNFTKHYGAFPLNVWVGATMEREDYRDRIDILRHLRHQGIIGTTFLSIEPLIGSAGILDLDGIDWVIIGGESGPGAREMKYEWVREVIDQCLEQKVPVFMKQWGIPENNPIFAKGGRAAVNKLDPVGKGGCLVDGVAYKEFPPKKLRIRAKQESLV